MTRFAFLIDIEKKIFEITAILEDRINSQFFTKTNDPFEISVDILHWTHSTFKFFAIDSSVKFSLEIASIKNQANIL